jgi:hypothetical protein
MPRLSEKYIAGFLDADGSIGVYFVNTTSRPRLTISFSQNTSQDEVIYRIHEELRCGSMCQRISNMNTRYTTLSLGGSDAVKLLNRVGKYLVVKRHFAEVAMDMKQKSISRNEIEAAREFLLIHRFMRSYPIPPYPSRNWTAGYLDGDGCFSITSLNSFGEVKDLVLHVAADKRKTEGIELLSKLHGGNIYNMSQGRCKQWILRLKPSKVKVFFPDLAKRMIVKADQARFLLGCAEMNHFRDGKNIKSALKHLKAQPHRLNEPKVDLTALLSTVRDLPKGKRSDYGQFVRNERGWIIGKSI